MKIRFRSVIFTVAIGSAVLATACKPDDQRTDSLDPATAGRSLSPAAAAQLDSGNTAYRLDDFAGAVTHYERVTELAGSEATGWFGLFMAYTEMGNDSAAADALLQARNIAPGASLIHGTAADTLTDGGGI